MVLRGPPERRGSGVTEKQERLYRFICHYHAVHGYSPSYDEMRERLGLASKSGVHRLVHALVERGALTVEGGPHRARNLTPATAGPPKVCPECGYVQPWKEVSA